MASASPRRSGGLSWPLVLLIAIGLLVVVGAALFVYVLIAGQVTVPFTDPPRVISFAAEEQEQEWQPAPGDVAIPVSGRQISAYSKVTRDDLWDLRKQNFSVVWLPEDKVSDVVIRDINKIVGRVLAHEKRAGYGFSDGDFMPEGTRPGLVGGIPPGMRAMRVQLDQVRGLYGLNPGDRFDVVAAIAVEGDAADHLKRYGGVYSDRVALEASLGALSQQATVRVIVQNGIVVTPVQTVEIPVASASLTRGRSNRTRPVQEVVVAVQPAEVAALTEAMTVDADLAVIPRSGHPDDDSTSVTPSSTPRSPFSTSEGDSGSTGMQLVESIGGRTRELVPVPEIGTAPKDKDDR
jgi:Flp pilus assembly protein CpaB